LQAFFITDYLKAHAQVKGERVRSSFLKELVSPQPFIRPFFDQTDLIHSPKRRGKVSDDLLRPVGVDLCM
jgi:hypothetical protein